MLHSSAMRRSLLTALLTVFSLPEHSLSGFENTVNKAFHVFTCTHPADTSARERDTQVGQQRGAGARAASELAGCHTA